MGQTKLRARAPAASPGDLPDTPGAPRAAVAFLYLLSFLSGIAALIYEVTWAKMLALTFGSTTLSAAAVIAGFMGGMGIGARAYHLIYDRLSRPLLLYGCLEMGIAASTALLTLTFYSLPQLFAQVSAVVAPGLWLSALRFTLVFVLLLLPSMLMGATFPALCTVLIRNVCGVDRHLGVIYGVNTVGAAAGVALAGLVLIERYGLSASVSVANGINVAVGCAAFALIGTSLSRRAGPSSVTEETAIPTHLPRWVTGAVLFLSGFATLSYEILWFRALRYLVGNSTYALATVLLVFLVGLGLGSLMLRRVARRRSPERDLGLCQCAIAVLALAAVACESLVLELPGLRDHVSIFSKVVLARPWWGRLLVDVALATAIMLPATLFMGLSFPLASRLYLGDVKQLGARVGGAYLLASLGGILGSVLGAVLLLPLFGTIGGTKASVLLNLTLGVVLLLWSRRRAAGRVWHAVGAAVVVAGLLFALPSSMVLHGEQIEGAPGRVIFVEEGDVTTVQVLQPPDDPSKKAMTVDGYKIAWSTGFRPTTYYRKQVLLAHLPMTLDTRIRHTLNVGLGGGATLHALASYPELQSLDCVEISKAVVRASRLFEESSVLDDPRVTLIVDDAVHYLLRTRKSYDLIISDGKQHPFFSGNAVLLCREFYRYSLRRLTGDGLFVQWLPLATLNTDLRIILRTLCDVFPHVETFYFPLDSVFMVGSREPLSGRPRLTPEAFGSSPAYEHLVTYLIHDPTVLLSRWTGGKRQLQQILTDDPISTWDHLLLDYSPFKATGRDWSRAKAANLRLLLAAEQIPRSDAEISLDPADSPYYRSSLLVRRALADYFAGNLTGATSLARQAVQANPEDADAKAILTFLRTRKPK